MINGLDIVQRTYERLRRPDDLALPYPTILRVVAEVVSLKRLDLTLSEQNSTAKVSDWFTPPSADSELGNRFADMLLPVRVERREIASEEETGAEVPVVNYSVLNTSSNGAISFYGTPLRMAFRDTNEFIQTQEYRIVYEPDFTDDVSLEQAVNLPDFFKGMVALEAAYKLLEAVEDTSPEWAAFVEMVSKKWLVEISDWRVRWDKFVRRFRGKAQIPKRVFPHGSCGGFGTGGRIRFFKGDY